MANARSPTDQSWLARYNEFVRTCKQWFGNHADAEDAAHDAVEALLARADHTVSVAHSCNFLHKTAHHRSIDNWRKNQRFEHVSWEDLPASEHPETAGAEAATHFEQLSGALMSALEELPLNYRQAFILNRIEGWTQADIARQLKISVSSVERYISHATRHIREQLSQGGWDEI